jgi:uncharacterized protein YpmS
MNFLPLFVFGSLFFVFSGQILFSSDTQNSENETKDNKLFAIELTEDELADVIAIYVKQRANRKSDS